MALDFQIKAGTTSKMIAVFLADNSVGSGAGLTGLTSSSTNLVWYYYREGAGSGATQVTLANPTLGTWSSGGFKAIDGTNMPGMYELHIPDAAIAAGAKWVKFYIFEKTTTALNLAPRELTIDLVAYDPYDTVRLGLTAMPNVASGSAGAIITSGTGTAQLSVTSGVAQADATKIGGTTQTGRDIGASVLLSSGTGTGQLDFTSGVVKANATQFAGQTITCSGGVTIPAATLASTTNIAAGTITTVTNLTTNNDKTGYSLASTGLDLVLIDGVGLPTAMKYVAAATAGKSAVSGSTVTFTGIDGSTLHITATTDSNGQRTAVSYS